MRSLRFWFRVHVAARVRSGQSETMVADLYEISIAQVRRCCKEKRVQRTIDQAIKENDRIVLNFVNVPELLKEQVK